MQVYDIQNCGFVLCWSPHLLHEHKITFFGSRQDLDSGQICVYFVFAFQEASEPRKIDFAFSGPQKMLSSFT